VLLLVTGTAFESLQPSPGRVICYLIGDEGLLFSQVTGRLYRLNTTAAFIWCCCEEGLKPLAIAGRVAERFAIPRNRARRDVVRALTEWKSLGLLATAAVPAVESPPDAWCEPPAQTGTPRRIPDSAAARHERHYRLLDARLRVRYPCQPTEALLHPIFAHLEAGRDDGPAGDEAVFAIVEDEGGYALLRDGVQVSDRVDLLELAAAIQRQALILAYESSACLVAVHAAAVGAGERGVLLPGATGSGKSTLTAALIGAGFTYLTDELTLLMPEPGRIRPAPVSLGLKRGSWPLLAAAGTALDALPIHHQEGREIRYLSPPENPLRRQETYAIQFMVFPHTCRERPPPSSGWALRKPCIGSPKRDMRYPGIWIRTVSKI